MRSAFLVALVALLVPVAVLHAADAPAPAVTRPEVSPEPFFRHPDFGEIALSPSGGHLAALTPFRGRVALTVIDLDRRTSSVVATDTDWDIAWFRWVNDRRLVFGVQDAQAELGRQAGGGLFAVDRDGANARELAPTFKAVARTGILVYRYTELLATLDDGSDAILVVSNERNLRFPDVYRLDTRTGRRTPAVDVSPGDAVAWVADRKGVVRAAVTDDKTVTSRTWWRAGEDTPWVMIGESKRNEPGIRPVAFDGDGTLIVASNVGRDTFALYRYDAAQRKLGEAIASSDAYDLDGPVVFDPVRKKIVGVRYDAQRPGTAWLDDDWARLARSVDAALPDTYNAITPGTGTRLLVRSVSDRNPGTFHLLDTASRKLEFVGVRRRPIDPARMPAREPVSYAARDGLVIRGYLTLPPDGPREKLPLVMLVHGGPWLRGGEWTWNAEAAYLASLGYAVLEPDFRGSLGYGRKLFEAGWKQWGRAMQDDLDDGMDWLAKRGTIDPARACIMGASYGGYAVMMGLARDPARWRCGINYVGVTDINLMFDVAWSDFANSDFIRYSAKDMLGDPVADAALLKSVSPVENASRIKGPVLMAYGAADLRVPLVHGEKMRDALLRNGTPVEWVVYTDEGHGFLLERNRIDFYRRVAAFLDRNIGR